MLIRSLLLGSQLYCHILELLIILTRTHEHIFILHWNPPIIQLVLTTFPTKGSPIKDMESYMNTEMEEWNIKVTVQFYICKEILHCLLNQEPIILIS